MDCFICPSVLRDITKWTRCCMPCQRSKVQRHILSHVQPFAPPSERFQHVHVNLVGPLPPSVGFTLLTCIVRYARCPFLSVISLKKPRQKVSSRTGYRSLE
ncbi:transposon Ty3-I Gag-Pol polyprotein [Trichonephila clavata]|uniref:Transposon Ty3-I Gag-Pol polyprotein n=1 Tax=Trichonephila clavata TaxID=2740835 RepID=A0A8X6H0U4_TRICU|nr:transposon Ty3-I Gag-Pol polyprotein [Trichonephila clavata]